MYQFNPISGNPTDGGLIELDYEIQQVTLLHETKHDFLKSILLFDKQNKAHVFPESASSDLV